MGFSWCCLASGLCVGCNPSTFGVFTTGINRIWRNMRNQKARWSRCHTQRSTTRRSVLIDRESRVSGEYPSTWNARSPPKMRKMAPSGCYIRRYRKSETVLPTNSHPRQIYINVDQLRFTINRSTTGSSFPEHISCKFSLRMAELGTIGAFWLSQASSLHQQIQPYLLDPKTTLSLSTSFSK